MQISVRMTTVTPISACRLGQKTLPKHAEYRVSSVSRVSVATRGIAKFNATRRAQWPEAVQRSSPTAPRYLLQYPLITGWLVTLHPASLDRLTTNPVMLTIAYDAISSRNSGVNKGIRTTQSHRLTGSAKDSLRARRVEQAKAINYYLKRNKDRDAGIRDAVMKGQHSMTAVGKALGVAVSRISWIVNAGNEK